MKKYKELSVQYRPPLWEGGGEKTVTINNEDYDLENADIKIDGVLWRMNVNEKKAPFKTRLFFLTNEQNEEFERLFQPGVYAIGQKVKEDEWFKKIMNK